MDLCVSLAFLRGRIVFKIVFGHEVLSPGERLGWKEPRMTWMGADECRRRAENAHQNDQEWSRYSRRWFSNVPPADPDRSADIFRLASDLEIVPKRSELARSAVWADFQFCVNCEQVNAAIGQISKVIVA